MESLICPYHSLPETLANAILLDRRRQFVDRLQWDLVPTPNGLEIDEYDDVNSKYLLVHKGEKHLGSCRVRPTSASNMLVDHFLDSFPEAPRFLSMQKGRVYELTRFCRSPELEAWESRLVVLSIAALMDRFRHDNQLIGFVAVVFPHVARFMDMINMRYLTISKSLFDGRELLMVCITQASNFDLEDMTRQEGLFSFPPDEPIAA